MDISLCLCTFRRPALLDTLLADLARQDRLGLTCELIVVDNDPQQSAASVLDTWRATFPFELRPLHVPEPNIALARNAAVQAARGEFIVFIDDDEQPSDAWLAQLIQTQRSSQADVVIGPVEGRLPPDAPDWMARGGFFAAPSMPTGTRLRYTQAYSGNCLLRAAMLARLKGPFDPAFGVTGGSDTMLFRDAELAGATIIWSEEARVSEEVPPSRANLRWILRRGYRGGQSFIRSDLARRRGWDRAGRTLWLGLRATAQLLIAGALALACLPFSKARGIRWLRTACAQLGKLGALAGHRYLEYAV